jgi:hypothetical protein
VTTALAGWRWRGKVEGQMVKGIGLHQRYLHDSVGNKGHRSELLSCVARLHAQTYGRGCVAYLYCLELFHFLLRIVVSCLVPA